MKKKLIALAVVAINALLVLIPQSHAASASGSVLSRQTAVALVRDSSTDAWNARENIRFARKDYETQLLKSQSIDIEKTSFRNPFTDEDEYFYYDDLTQMQLKLMKEFMPEQMKYVWEIREKAYAVTENALANAADNLFYGLYGTYQNKLLAQKTLDMAKRALEREEIRFNSGLITALDLEGSKLDVQAQENAIIKADRDYQNMHRQFNQLAGLPLDYRYDLIGTPWLNRNSIAVSEDEAVSQALENRMELWDLNQQIHLVLKKIEIYQHRNAYKSDPQAREDYEKAMDELEELKLKLSEIKYDIEKEIRAAYQSVKTSFIDLEMSKLELAKMKNQLENVTAQYESGLVPISVVEQLENAVNQLELAMNMKIVSVLNDYDRFSRAISVGPGY